MLSKERHQTATGPKYRLAAGFSQEGLAHECMCARVVLKYSNASERDIDTTEFKKAVGRELLRFTGARARGFEATAFARMIFNLQRRFLLRESNDFMTAIIVIITFEGVLKQYDPNINFQMEALRFLAERRDEPMPRAQRISVFESLRRDFDAA